MLYDVRIFGAAAGLAAAGALTLAGWALLFQGTDSPRPFVCHVGQYEVNGNRLCLDHPVYPGQPPVRAG